MGIVGDGCDVPSVQGVAANPSPAAVGIDIGVAVPTGCAQNAKVVAVVGDAFGVLPVNEVAAVSAEKVDVAGDGYDAPPVQENRRKAKAALRRQIESYLFERSLQMAMQDAASARKALALAQAKAEESVARLAKCRAEEAEALADLQAKCAELEVQRVRRAQARRRGKSSATWR